jgi:hypothetical protein
LANSAYLKIGRAVWNQAPNPFRRDRTRFIEGRMPSSLEMGRDFSNGDPRLLHIAEVATCCDHLGIDLGHMTAVPY